MKRILILSAHNTGLILGMAGTIAMHNQEDPKNCEVHVVIFSAGERSHDLVLGIRENPKISQVKEARLKETEEAMKILKVDHWEVWGVPDSEGKHWQNNEELLVLVSDIIKRIDPDIIYCPYPDTHVDHRAVNNVVMKILKNLPREIQVYQYFVFTRELPWQAIKEMIGQFITKMKNEIKAGNFWKAIIELVAKSSISLPKIPKKNVSRAFLSLSALSTKQKALEAMKSQILIKPYPDWQTQRWPILVPGFVKFVLGETKESTTKEIREETFVKVQ